VAQQNVLGERLFLPIPLLAITLLVLCSFTIAYFALKMMRLAGQWREVFEKYEISQKKVSCCV